MDLLAPLLKFHLKRRLKYGKEDPLRVHERFGEASFLRPPGKLIWFHGASVGESVSILKLISSLLKEDPNLNLLVTTGTLTSAHFLRKRLPEKCIHQFIPLDVPKWVNRFLDHWCPDLTVFVESEFWPNLLRSIKARKVPLLLLNARLSQRSFEYWRFIPKTGKEILQFFDACFTPSLQTVTYLQKLGAKNIHISCHLKFAADPLWYDQEELNYLRPLCESRVVWAATSTHQGEEDIVISTHMALKQKFPDLLTILAPRHPERSKDLLKKIREAHLSALCRSEGAYPHSKTDIWIIDTIGDLGLVYSLARVCFIGGSFIPIGGHNPIEPFKLGSTAIVGPYTHNFLEVNTTLTPPLTHVQTPKELQSVLETLLSSEDEIKKQITLGQKIISQQCQGLQTLADKVLNYSLESLPGKVT